MMEHIYIKDDRNRKYDHMANLREGVANHIFSNIVKMQKAGMSITSCSADPGDDGSFAKQIGYTKEDGLYDKLILEYNAEHQDALLDRWTRD